MAIAEFWASTISGPVTHTASVYPEVTSPGWTTFSSSLKLRGTKVKSKWEVLKKQAIPAGMVWRNAGLHERKQQWKESYDLLSVRWKPPRSKNKMSHVFRKKKKNHMTWACNVYFILHKLAYILHIHSVQERMEGTQGSWLLHPLVVQSKRSKFGEYRKASNTQRKPSPPSPWQHCPFFSLF